MSGVTAVLCLGCFCFFCLQVLDARSPGWEWRERTELSNRCYGEQMTLYLYGFVGTGSRYGQHDGFVTVLV